MDPSGDPLPGGEDVVQADEALGGRHGGSMAWRGGSKRCPMAPRRRDPGCEPGVVVHNRRAPSEGGSPTGGMLVVRRSRAATMVAISAVLAIAAAIAPSGAPGTRAASGTVTGFTLHDASRAVTLVEPSSTFGAPIWLDAGRTLQAAIMPPQNFGTNFVLRVGAASGQSLAVAAYPATHDPEVAGSPVAALETSLWCGPQDGSFTILEPSDVPGTAIIALAIRFDLGCDTSYARTGEYRYHSTIGYGGPSIAPLTLPLMAGGTTATATATYQNRGTLPIAISAVTIGGYDTFAFSIQADGCSGTAVAPGSSCAVSVDF